MTKLLSEAALARYRRDGLHFPVDVLSTDEAAGLRARLEAFEAREGKPLAGNMRHKAHLLFTWLNELVHHPRILDAVEDVLGPDLLCWSSNFFIKEAHDPGYVSWHQDATYWGLSSPDVITAWVALSPATIESGAMRMIPGSHNTQHAHRDTWARDNLLSRGQEVMVDVDAKGAVDILLQPGQASLHHVLIVHGSEPNRSADRRIGFAIRYIPTHLHQTVPGPRDSATLVRGIDRYHHFDHEPAPDRDLSEQAWAAHRDAAERSAAILYAGTRTRSFENVMRS
jgi:ectoine hydroxylase-related dioxygenase (phytanoyl-CoA dioxygenase family)